MHEEAGGATAEGVDRGAEGSGGAAEMFLPALSQGCWRNLPFSGNQGYWNCSRCALAAHMATPRPRNPCPQPDKNTDARKRSTGLWHRNVVLFQKIKDISVVDSESNPLNFCSRKFPSIHPNHLPSKE